MSNEDYLAKVRHKVAGDRLLIVADNFEAQHPLDTVVKTTSDKTAYGFIPAEIADKLGAKPAPVIVTEELFDHLDVKGTRIQTVAQRGFNDMRDAVKTARASVDIKSMSPEEKKAYFSNKAAFDIAAVQKAFGAQAVIDNSIDPRKK